MVIYLSGLLPLLHRNFIHKVCDISGDTLLLNFSFIQIATVTRICPGFQLQDSWAYYDYDDTGDTTVDSPLVYQVANFSVVTAECCLASFSLFIFNLLLASVF